MVDGCLSLSLPVQWSCFLSLTFSYSYLLSPTVSSTSKELLHVSHCLLLFLSVSNNFFLCHGVGAYPTLPLIVASCLSLSVRSHGVATSLSSSLIVARCLSLPLLGQCSYSMSLTVHYSCWLALTIYSSSMELLHVSHCLP